MYLTHEPDEDTPIEETLRALDEVVRAGKARAIGASNLDGAGLEQALETSTRLGLARFGWVQNEYSLLRREAEARDPPDLRARGARLHAVQPARRRMADREVPARRGVPFGLADDAAPRPVRRPGERGDVPTVSRPSRPRPPTSASSRRRSRWRGCSATRRSRRWSSGPGGRSSSRPRSPRPSSSSTSSGTRRAGRVVRVSELLVLGHDEVKRLLPMDECVELMESVLADLARGSVWQPLRFVIRPPEEPSLMGLMPAHRSAPSASYGLKVICIFPSNAERGLDLHQGGVLLFDGETGAAARAPRRLRRDRDPHGRRVGRRDAPARPQGRPAPGDPRLGRAGAVAPARRWQRRASSRTRASGAGRRSARPAFAADAQAPFPVEAVRDRGGGVARSRRRRDRATSSRSRSSGASGWPRERTSTRSARPSRPPASSTPRPSRPRRCSRTRASRW